MTVQFWEGQVLFVDGAVAMHERCCCIPACLCGDVNLLLTISNSKSRDGIYCSPNTCSDLDGNYCMSVVTWDDCTWSSAIQELPCYDALQLEPTSWTPMLKMEYNEITNKWDATLHAGGSIFEAAGIEKCEDLTTAIWNEVSSYKYCEFDVAIIIGCP